MTKWTAAPIRWAVFADGKLYREFSDHDACYHARYDLMCEHGEMVKGYPPKGWRSKISQLAEKILKDHGADQISGGFSGKWAYQQLEINAWVPKEKVAAARAALTAAGIALEPPAQKAA